MRRDRRKDGGRGENSESRPRQKGEAREEREREREKKGARQMKEEYGQPPDLHKHIINIVHYFYKHN